MVRLVFVVFVANDGRVVFVPGVVGPGWKRHFGS